MDDFLGMFKDAIFVAIPKQGGALLHTRDLKKVMARNGEKMKDGAYFTVNGFSKFVEGDYHGRTKANVTSFNANFLDIDLTPETRRTEAEAVYKALCDTGLKPTAVVLTGKGLHVYWVYKQPAEFSEYRLKEYEILQTAIVEHFKEAGADRQARDAARVLRIPGAAYWNGKGERTCDIELLYFHPEQLYEPREVAAYFRNSIKTETKEGEALVRGDSDFDLARIFNVGKGARHHMAYSAALSLIQRAKTLADARMLFNAAIGTWASPIDDPLDVMDCWAQFDNAVKMLEKDRPQLFAGPGDSAPIKFTAFDDVTDEKLEWLWEGILAKGKSHILSGAPGLGKSQVTLDMAARISTGAAFPSYTLGGGSKREPMGVIILSAEDGAGDTIKPRLKAAGANLRYVWHMPSAKLVKTKGGKMAMSSVSLREDAEMILEAISTLPHKVGLIIIDPASAFMSEDADSNSNSDVRAMLAQLQAVIMDKGIAMVMINHLNKNTSAKSAHNRSLGSTAWTAVARGTMYVMRDPADKERVIFSPDKMNLAKKAGNGFFYRIEEKGVTHAGEETMAPHVEWDAEEFPVKSTDEYMADDGRAPERANDCEEDLDMYMATKGEVPAKEGLEYMKERGYSQIQIYRAARKLGFIGEAHGVWKK